MPETMSAPKKEIPKSVARVCVPKGAKVNVRLAGVELGEDVTFVATGKVTRISQDQYDKSLELEVSQVKIIGKD